MARQRQRPKSGTHCHLCDELNRDWRGELAAGKRALDAKHKTSVNIDIDCSMNLETALASYRQENEKIFDYLLVRRSDCRPLLVEVHPASSTSQVKVLAQKQGGSRKVFARAGLSKKLENTVWYWISQGGKIAFGGRNLDKYSKQLQKAKIIFRRDRLAR